MNYRPFDLEAAKRGEPIICRDGLPAKFIAHVPEGGNYHRVAFLRGRVVMATNENGKFSIDLESYQDLFMAPVKLKLWINCYPNHSHSTHMDRYNADQKACSDRIACIEIEYEEGQGL